MFHLSAELALNPHCFALRTLYMSCAYLLPTRVEPVREGRCAGHCTSLMSSTFPFTADVVAARKVGCEAASCSPACKQERSARLRLHVVCLNVAYCIDMDSFYAFTSAFLPTNWQ